ncbi:unnamed protein product [Acanthoscelides obtectus]|uniref:Uncharacterized protein n=1 Tax=Acanthoscelides obtectus TaxID=200917 RepID=A0A9P0KFZ7_ACAOB|nr:unnamed protein product [Acanthoscelides obtectus]CAK1647620.1 hypothetical protein AOBTE_LOCUS15300 [Acanthoscelides obtectus]
MINDTLFMAEMDPDYDQTSSAKTSDEGRFVPLTDNEQLDNESDECSEDDEMNDADGFSVGAIPRTRLALNVGQIQNV